MQQADPSRVYLLRSCRSDFRAHGGYLWPSVVGAECHPERWDPSPVCGDGLHGFVNGEGGAGLADWSDAAQWIVFSAPINQVVALGPSKSKAAVARIEHVGVGDTGADRRRSCLAFLARIGRLGPAAMGVQRQGGDGSTLTGGARSTLTGGSNSILIFRWWDYVACCMRLVVGDGKLKPNTAYTVRDCAIVEVERERDA